MKYDVVNLDTINQLGTSIPANYHNRYQCPSCKAQGKNYFDFKLYINVKTNVGFCFRCETVYVVGKDVPDLSVVLELLREYLMDSEAIVEPLQHTRYSLNNTKPLSGSIEATEYLKGRGIKQEILDYWGVRAMTIADKGYVFIPDRVDEEDNSTNFYQLRVLDKETFPKYKSAKTQLPLMKLWKHTHDRLFLVEGTIDAMSIGVEAIPVLGKNISKYQKMMLYDRYMNSKTYPRYVYLSLDGGCIEEMRTMYEKLKDVFMFKSKVYVVSMPYGADSNELGDDYWNYVNKAVRVL